MREQFEKLPRIARILVETGVYYSYTNERYTSCYEKGHESYLCGFVNGAWYAFQEQQEKIARLQSRIDGAMDFYNTAKSDVNIGMIRMAQYLKGEVK